MAYTKIILSVLIFLFMMVLGGWVASTFLGGQGMDASTPDLVACMSILSGLLSVLCIWRGLGTMEIQPSLSCASMRRACATSGINLPIVFMALLGTLSALFGANLLSEMIALPDTMEAQFAAMASRPWGVLSICLVAPLVEELIFREGITGYLLRQGAAPHSAILCSSAAFSLMHLNPAQMPFAFLIGVVLALLYWRTRSIWLSLLMHCVNNSLAVVLMNSTDASLTQLLGLSRSTSLLLIVFSCVASIALLLPFCRSGRSASAAV